MAKTPIIILAGKAKSGKDTVGQYIADNYGGVCLGMADPMKRFAAQVFGFTEEQLWGPSEMRDPVVESTVANRLSISDRFYNGSHDELLDSIVPVGSARTAKTLLERWFEGIYGNSLGNDIPVSPRFVLQTLGTEWGRHVSVDMWSLYAINQANLLACGGYSYTRTGGIYVDLGNNGYDYGTLTDGRFRNEVVNVSKVNGGSGRIRRDNVKAGGGGGVSGHASEKLDLIPDHFFSGVLWNLGSLSQLYDQTDALMQRTFSDERGEILTTKRSHQRSL